ncbi:MAG TPA: hypothetical protein VID04_10545 [Methylomirabilota bacterium]|jgi:hypothetical protein
MLRAVTLRALALVALTLMLGACASAREVEQRTTQGPTADQLWMYKMVLTNGREPSFDERMYWQNDLEDQIGRYLRSHPTAANSLEVSTFRFYRRVAVGMTKDQVVILLGPPTKTTSDAAEMEKAARKYWPQVKDRAKEAWAYPMGWFFYFADDRVVDITRYVPRKILLD